jgi:hypothetical protein
VKTSGASSNRPAASVQATDARRLLSEPWALTRRPRLRCARQPARESFQVGDRDEDEPAEAHESELTPQVAVEEVGTAPERCSCFIGNAQRESRDADEHGNPWRLVRRAGRVVVPASHLRVLGVLLRVQIGLDAATDRQGR